MQASGKRTLFFYKYNPFLLDNYSHHSRAILATTVIKSGPTGTNKKAISCINFPLDYVMVQEGKLNLACESE